MLDMTVISARKALMLVPDAGNLLAAQALIEAKVQDYFESLLDGADPVKCQAAVIALRDLGALFDRPKVE